MTTDSICSDFRELFGPDWSSDFGGQCPNVDRNTLAPILTWLVDNSLDRAVWNEVLKHRKRGGIAND